MQEARNTERGGVMVVVMISLVGLISLGALALMSARTATFAGATDRFDRVALHAAESGVYVAMQYLRENRPWTDMVEPGNEGVQLNYAILGNGKPPSDAENLFNPDTQAWYEVYILNNEDDPAFTSGTDSDERLVLQAIGYGPNNAVVTLYVEFAANGIVAGGVPCTSYGQVGHNELGSGLNPCGGTIDTGAIEAQTIID